MTSSLDLPTVIGIDCATRPQKIGLALAVPRGKQLAVVEARTAKGRRSPAEIIAAWISPSCRTLLAMDSPLGWPEALGRTLLEHRAGERISVDPDHLFQRHSDRCLRERTGRKPLEVGANLIARTAHSALSLLGDISEILQQAIPVGWSPKLGDGVSAIEVYPAATLIAHGLPASGYKARGESPERASIILALGESLLLKFDTTILDQNPDVLDAAICVLGGLDFLQGRAVGPDDLELAKKEGWTWVAEPQRTIR